jgi:hypothetical protein
VKRPKSFITPLAGPFDDLPRGGATTVSIARAPVSVSRASPIMRSGEGGGVGYSNSADAEVLEVGPFPADLYADPPDDGADGMVPLACGPFAPGSR